MKKTILLVFALIAISCSKEAQPQQQQSSGTFDGVFYATIEQSASSKVELDGLNVNWVEGDTISVFDSQGAHFKFLAMHVNGSSCVFIQSEKTPGTPEAPFYAIYPYRAGNKISGNIITSEFNDTHIVSEPGLTKKAGNIMTAYTNGNTFNFKNACALLKVTIPEDVSVTKLGFVFQDAVIGEANFTIDTDGCSSVTMADPSSATKNIDVSKSSKIDHFPAGEYFLPIIPTTLNGFRILITYGSGSPTQSDAMSSFTFTTKRNKVVNIGTLYDGRPWYKWMTFENGLMPSEITETQGTVSIVDNPHQNSDNPSKKVFMQEVTSGKTTNGNLVYSTSALKSNAGKRITGIKYQFYSNGEKFCPRMRFNYSSTLEVQPYSINGTLAPEGGWTKDTVQAAYDYTGWNTVVFRADQISGTTNISGWSKMNIRSMVFSSGSSWDKIPATVYLDNIGFIYE